MSQPIDRRLSALVHRELLETVVMPFSWRGAAALAVALPLALTVGPYASLYLSPKVHTTFESLEPALAGITMFFATMMFAAPMQTRTGSLVRRLILLAGLFIVLANLCITRHPGTPSTFSEVSGKVLSVGGFGMILLAVSSYYIIRAIEKVASFGKN